MSFSSLLHGTAESHGAKMVEMWPQGSSRTATGMTSQSGMERNSKNLVSISSCLRDILYRPGGWLFRLPENCTCSQYHVHCHVIATCIVQRT